MKRYILSSTILLLLTACQMKEIIGIQRSIESEVTQEITTQEVEAELQTVTEWEQIEERVIETVDEELSSYAQTALNKHNQLRELHFSDAPLVYSLEVEQDAQAYADFLAQSGQFDHDPNNRSNKYGENLYAFSSPKKPDIANIIQSWYNEKDEYDYERKACLYGIRCRHYTQVVWKDSKRLGCASAKYERGRFKGGYVTVCKYHPYGNILGQDPF